MTRSPTLLLLGSGAAAEPDVATAVDLLTSADAVFAGPPGPDIDPESAALFYVEAWRVERLHARDAAARLADWFGARPTGRAALVVAGSVEDDVAFGAALDGLVLHRPEVRVHRRRGVGVAPPHRTSLMW